MTRANLQEHLLVLAGDASDIQIQRSRSSLKPQAHASSKLCLNENSFILKERKEESPSSLLCGKILRPLLFFSKPYNRKGNAPPCLQSPLVSRQVVYLPVCRHGRLNTLTNRGWFFFFFLSKESLSGGNRAWMFKKTYCTNILYQQ